eukprot:1700810-Rhodomonas_salina.1
MVSPEGVFFLGPEMCGKGRGHWWSLSRVHPCCTTDPQLRAFCVEISVEVQKKRSGRCCEDGACVVKLRETPNGETVRSSPPLLRAVLEKNHPSLQVLLVVLLLE